MKELVKELKDAITTDKSTKPYDTTAKVVRTEGDTIWVHIDGGVDETPVAKTISAKAGDIVKVRVSGGSAWIQGNESAPPTDDTLAIIARENANAAQVAAHVASDAAKAATEDAGTARTAATQAVQDAAEAKTAADTANGLLEDMQDAAEDAGTTLTGIYADAAEAKETVDEINAYADTAGKTVTQILNDGETAGTAAQEAKAAATNASEYAARALGNLSTVQNVTETLNWITAHGTMALTSDIELDPTHVYFVQDNNGDYTVGGTKYAVVTEPDVADISTYYELSIDQSLNNYVGTHLAVTSEGLWLIPEEGATPTTSSKKILIAVGGTGHTYEEAGTYIIEKVNDVDTIVAKFLANGAQIGQDSTTHMTLGSNALLMYDENGEVIAKFGDVITLGQTFGDQVSYLNIDEEGLAFLLSSELIPVFYRVDEKGRIGLIGGNGSPLANSFNHSLSSNFNITLSQTPKTGTPISILGRTAAGQKNYREFVNFTAGTAETKKSIGTDYGTFAYDGASDISFTKRAGSTAIGPTAERAEFYVTSYTGVFGTFGSRLEGYRISGRSITVGDGLIATYPQIVCGKYNEEDANWKYPFIIGNGARSGKTVTLSNAFDVNWNGEIRMALDTTATSGTDKEVYDALVTLGWDSDVISGLQEITIDTASHGSWVDSGSTVDGNVVYKSDGSYNVNGGWDTAKITFKGYKEFKLNIRSYAEGNYDYVLVSTLGNDYLANCTSTGSMRSAYNNTEYTKAYTRGKQSATAYEEVVFENLDPDTEYYFYVIYQKDSSNNSNDDRGYFYFDN